MGCQYTLTSELYWQDCSDYDIEVCLYDGSCVGFGTGDSAKYLEWSGSTSPRPPVIKPPDEFPLNFGFVIEPLPTTTTTIPPIFTTTPKPVLKYINKCDNNTCNNLGF